MSSDPINPKPSPLQDRDRALRRREKRWRRQKQSAELRAKWTYARNFNYFDDETCDGLREVNAQRERKEHFNSMSVRRIQAKAIVREAARRSMPVDLKDEPDRLYCPVTSDTLSDTSEPVEKRAHLLSGEAIARRRLEEKWKVKSKRAKRRSKLACTRREGKKLRVVERIPRMSEVEVVEGHSKESLAEIQAL